MKKKILAVAITVVLLLGVSFIPAVYYGYIHVNGWKAGKYPVRGVDVSHYQGEIDWEVLSGENIMFAYIKATEGSSHIDEKFEVNCREAGKTELKVGAYHFFSFDSPGLTQAENFIGTVDAFEGMLPPVVDVEFYGNKKENPTAPDLVETELQVFLNLLEETYGRKPVIYATEEAWELYIRGRFDEYPLWIRNIWKKPVLKSGQKESREQEWLFWQYTNRGRLKGFSGEEKFVDLNVFGGTKEQWQAWSEMPATA